MHRSDSVMSVLMGLSAVYGYLEINKDLDVKLQVLRVTTPLMPLKK